MDKKEEYARQMSLEFASLCDELAENLDFMQGFIKTLAKVAKGRNTPLLAALGEMSDRLTNGEEFQTIAEDVSKRLGVRQVSISLGAITDAVKHDKLNARILHHQSDFLRRSFDSDALIRAKKASTITGRLAMAGDGISRRFA